MPRNGSGTFTLSQSPFVAGTTISSSAMNSDLSDIATALTASLPRDGQVGMSGALKAPDGSVTAPTLSFNNETNTGFFRSGAGELSVSILGVVVGIFSATGFSGSAVIPAGTVVDYAGFTAPAKWLLCFGQDVSRTTYADLFAIIGTAYGNGDGVTTFGIPDLRGRTTFGKDNMGGVASGRLSTTYFGADPTTLGVGGGTQATTILVANLPAYTPSGSTGNNSVDHNHSIATANTFNALSTTGGGAFGIPAAIAAGVSGGESAPHNHAFIGNAQGGSSTPTSNVPTAMILNKIIYAGV